MAEALPGLSGKLQSRLTALGIKEKLPEVDVQAGDENEGMKFTLDFAKPGDLLLMLAGTSEFGVIREKLQSRSRATESIS